jgi:hypothetical protein
VQESLSHTHSGSNGVPAAPAVHHSSSLQGQHSLTASAPDSRSSWQSDWEQQHRVPVLLTPASRQVEQQQETKKKQPLFSSHNGASPQVAQQQAQGSTQGSQGASAGSVSMRGGPSFPAFPHLHHSYYPTEALMLRLLSVSYTRLESFHPVDLALMAWSLASLRVSPPTAFLTALQRRAEAVGSMFTPQVRSCQRAGRGP